MRSSFDDPADPQARHPHLRRGRHHGTADRHRASPIRSDEAQITLRNVADKPGVAASIFVPLADANINVDMIIQVVSDDTADHGHDLHGPDRRLRARLRRPATTHRDEIDFQDLQGATDVVKVSAIGVGMRSHAGVAAKAFKALAEKGINIRAITTSEIKFSVLIDCGLYGACGAHAPLAIRP